MEIKYIMLYCWLEHGNVVTINKNKPENFKDLEKFKNYFVRGYDTAEKLYAIFLIDEERREKC